MATSRDEKSDPSDLIDDHVKRNYRERHNEGTSWESMADEAERMNDRNLAAHLRAEAEREGRTDRTTPPANRSATPASPAKGGKVTASGESGK